MWHHESCVEKHSWASVRRRLPTGTKTGHFGHCRDGEKIGGTKNKNPKSSLQCSLLVHHFNNKKNKNDYRVSKATTEASQSHPGN